MTRQAKQNSVTTVPVKFSGVSIGAGTARIGIKIERSKLDLARADELLCGRRLSGRIVVTQDEDADQQRLFAGKNELHAVFDSKRFGANPNEITAGLTFNLSDVETQFDSLGHFANRSGALQIDEVAVLADVEGGGAEPAGDAGLRHSVANGGEGGRETAE